MLCSKTARALVEDVAEYPRSSSAGLCWPRLANRPAIRQALPVGRWTRRFVHDPGVAARRTGSGEGHAGLADDVHGLVAGVKAVTVAQRASGPARPGRAGRRSVSRRAGQCRRAGRGGVAPTLRRPIRGSPAGKINAGREDSREVEALLMQWRSTTSSPPIRPEQARAGRRRHAQRRGAAEPDQRRRHLFEQFGDMPPPDRSTSGSRFACMPV